MKYKIFTLQKNFGDTNLSFWQSKNWQNILKFSNQAEEVFYFGNQESTFFLVEIRSVGAGFLGAFVLGIKNFQISSDFDDCFNELKNILKYKKCIFVQFEPLEKSEFIESFFAKNNQNLRKVTKNFLTPFTRIISLHDSADDILMKMPQKGRYAVRNAQKNGVIVKLLDNIDDHYLDVWMKLLHETTKRDNFSHNSREYYKKFLQQLSGNIIVAVGIYKEKIVAMTISVFSGTDAVYYYGASTSDKEGRKVAASYLLLWKTMELAREKGYKNYDLLGVSDPDNPNDSLAGVSQFKQKLGGVLVKLPSKFLYKLSWKYNIFIFLQKIRRIIK